MLKRMMKLWILAIPLALMLSAAVACGSNEAKDEVRGEVPTTVIGQVVEVDGGFYVDVSPEELWSMLAAKDFTLVNVLPEYIGEIEETDLIIPRDEMAGRLDELPAQLDSKIVVYCRSGNNSAAAATALVGAGYTNIWNLDGGMNAWVDAGYPLLNAQ